jgi:hypothetical protein
MPDETDNPDPFELAPRDRPSPFPKPDPARVPIIQARARLYDALRALRFTGAMGRLVVSVSELDAEGEVEWIDIVTAWITEFGTVLDDVAETAHEMDAELQRLRHERAAIRRFLGTGPESVTFDDTPTRQSEQ